MSTTIRPSYSQPAVIGGVIMGVLSALPIVSAGNVCCCLWVVVGGLHTTKDPAGIPSGALFGNGGPGNARWPCELENDCRGYAASAAATTFAYLCCRSPLTRNVTVPSTSAYNV